MIAFSAIALAVAITFLLVCLRVGGGRVSATPVWAILITAAAGPFLVALAIVQASGGIGGGEPYRWGDLRLELEQVRVAKDAMKDGLRVGGAGPALAAPDTISGQAPTGSDVIIDGAPPGLLAFTARPDGKIAIRAAPSLTDANAALVSIRQPGPFGGAQLVGVAPFHGGDVLCLDACDGPRPLSFKLSWNGRRLVRLSTPDTELATLPQRVPWPMPTFINEWAPSTRVFALRDYGAPAPETRDAVQPCGARLLCRADGQPVRSILLRRGGPLGGELLVGLLDPQARLTRADGTVVRAPGGEEVGAVAQTPGETHVSVLGVQYADADLPLSDHDAPWSRLSERRSFRVSAGGDGLKLAFDTPSVLTIRHDALTRAFDDLRARARAEGAPTPNGVTVSITPKSDLAGGARTDTRLAFDALAGRFSGEVAGRLTLPEKRAPVFSLVRAGGEMGGALRLEQPFGANFTLGDARQATFRLIRLDPDFGALILWWWLVPASAALALVADYGRRRASPTAWMLTAGLELLLAIRLLVAIEGAYVDSSHEANRAVGDSLAAYVAVPFLFSLFPSGAQGRPWIVMLRALFVVSALFEIRLTGQVGPTWRVLAAGVAIGASVAAWAWLSPTTRERARAWVAARWTSASDAVTTRGRKVWEPVAARTTVVGRGVARLTPQWIASGVAALPRWGLIGGGLLLIARLILGFLGFKESLPVAGARLSLSLIYAPLMIMICAAVLAAAARPEARANRAASLVFWGLFLALDAVVPVFVKDNGFVIYGLSIALWGFLVHLEGAVAPRRWFVETAGFIVGAALAVWACFAALTAFGAWGALAVLLLAGVAGTAAACLWSRSVMWAGPALAAAAVLLVLNLTPKASEQGFEAAAKSDSPAAATALLKSYTAENQNSLRLWNFMQPDRVHRVGTTTSEEFLASMAHLADYTRAPTKDEGGAGIAGRGFLNLTPPTVLRAYHFNDNVTAVHLVSPYGRLGAVSLLAMLWALAASLTMLTWRRDRPLADLNWRPVAGLTAVWTVALVTTYMVLANLQLAPFTGKDAYFLAATSTSDLLEGFVLMTMASVFLATPSRGAAP